MFLREMMGPRAKGSKGVGPLVNNTFCGMGGGLAFLAPRSQLERPRTSFISVLGPVQTAVSSKEDGGVGVPGRGVLELHPASRPPSRQTQRETSRWAGARLAKWDVGEASDVGKQDDDILRAGMGACGQA